RPMRLGLHHRPRRDPTRQDLRDHACHARIPRGVGFRRQWPRHHQSRSDPDAVLDVSLAGTALDRRPWRADPAYDLPAREAVTGLVQALLPRRPGFRDQDPGLALGRQGAKLTRYLHFISMT